MSAQCENTGRGAARQPMGLFERYLRLWVLLCIVAGIGLESAAPSVFQAVGRIEVAQVNLPGVFQFAAGLWTQPGGW